MAAYHVPHQTPSDVIIAIEGIDGAGKRTQTHLLKQQMETHGIKAGVVSFPRYGETFMAGTIADYLNGRFGEIDALPAHFPALLYAVDRFESRELIGQLLQENDVLLADRYVASNLAYQAAKLPSSAQEAFIAWLSQLEHEVYGLPHAEMTVYLDIPVAVSSALVARKGERSYTDAKMDLHEKDTAYLAACRDVYAVLAGRQHNSQWITVSCVDDVETLRGIDAIHADIWEGVSRRLCDELPSRTRNKKNEYYVSRGMGGSVFGL